MVEAPQDAVGVSPQGHSAGVTLSFAHLKDYSCLGNYVLGAHNVETESHLTIMY